MVKIELLNIQESMVRTAQDSVAHAAETVANYMASGASHPSNSWDFWNHPGWTDFKALTVWSVAIGMAAVIILIGIRLFAKHIISDRARDISLKYWFCFVWLYGFVVYDVGMCTGQYISLITNAPMAIIYAFKIFLFDSDVSEIHEPFHSSWFYSMNFALAHFGAAIISTLFLIKYFGFSILCRAKMWLASLKSAKPVADTFVFWGFNDKSINLINSIQKHYSDNPDYRIIIVRTSDSNDEKLEDRTGFARIFDFLAMPTSELERLQDLGCLTTGSYANLANVNSNGCDEDIIGSVLKLRSLKKILLRNTSQKIHFIFLSDNEKENLHDVALLLNDSLIKEFVNYKPFKFEPEYPESLPSHNSPDSERRGTDSETKREVIFYCLARYNSIHRVIEDQNPSDQIRVKVVDSSHINVEMLKLNQELLPVKYVNIEEDATVSSAFNALVVGFSEVGQDSVRFLYEFGAFVKRGSTNDIAVRSDFHLDVVDKNMADLAGTFVANAPAINPEMPFLKGDKNICCNGDNGKFPQDGKTQPAEEEKRPLITLHDMDCRSVQFYEKLSHEWIKTLNYVVIATDNDELNISLGVRIFKLAARYRKTMDKFCILVRAHNDDDGHIRRIAQHYNRLWEAYKHSPVDENKERIHQDKIHVGEPVDSPIHIFGLDRTTFTYSNVIADELEQKARKYTERYTKTVSPNKKITKTAWDDRFEELMQLKNDKNGNWKGFSPTFYGLLCLRRKEAQDMANSLHEVTKRILINEALERCNQKDFIFSRLTRKPDTTQYIWPRNFNELVEINRILFTIAQTEHLRWNASHEILGYVYANEKDEVTLEHNCLIDWSLLEEHVQSYDCNVSDFIFGIKFQNERQRDNTRNT